MKYSNKMKTSRLLIIITFTLHLFVLGCSDKFDEDLIGNNNCTPPCWMDIKPGKTDRVDALQLLEKMELEKKGSVKILDTDTIRWLNNTPKRYYLYSENGIINKIKIDYRPVSIDLKYIISLFGEPAKLNLSKISGGGYFVSMYYPDKGLVIAAEGNKTLYEVYPNMGVVFVYYLPSGTILDLEKSLNGRDVASENVLNLKTWKGYGIYNP
jgi:hypothetical protein